MAMGRSPLEVTNAMNTSQGQRSASEVVQAWLADPNPRYRENLERVHYSWSGVGIAKSVAGINFITQLFG
jgi:hypothetical protein